MKKRSATICVEQQSLLWQTVAVVEDMLAQMQKLFHAKQPLTRFLTYDEWAKQSEHYQRKIQEEIIEKKEVLLTGEATKQPTDTAEHRRQQERRRNPKPEGRKHLKII